VKETAATQGQSTVDQANTLLNDWADEAAESPTSPQHCHRQIEQGRFSNEVTLALRGISTPEDSCSRGSGKESTLAKETWTMLFAFAQRNLILATLLYGLGNIGSASIAPVGMDAQLDQSKQQLAALQTHVGQAVDDYKSAY
jgi:hypothetical protein